MAIAIAIARTAAKKSKYQTINPENQASGQCRRIRIANSSAAGLSSEKERMRAATAATTARKELAVLGIIGSVTLCFGASVVNRRLHKCALFIRLFRCQ
jgi:hypothetical protein